MTLHDTTVARQRWRPLVAPLSATVVLGIATLYTALADPYRPGFFPACVFLTTTGHYCPGCGGLRAVHELARGDIPAALGMNPVVVVVVVPLGIALLVAWWRSAWTSGRAPHVPLWLAIGLPVLLGVFWVARNIPTLMPYLAP